MVLSVACALILLVSNVINSSTPGSSSEQAQKTYSRRRDLHNEIKHAKTSLPASTVQAFVGVFTATKPERRHAVRSTWFPSSEADLARSAWDDSSAVVALFYMHASSPFAAVSCN